MTIKTDRLVIRNLAPGDWPGMQRIAEDFRRSEYVIYDMPLPVEEQAITDLTRRFADSGLFFAVFTRDLPDMIGYICFHNENGSFDLGYCFRSAYHRKGYAYESCAAMLDYMEQHHHVTAFTAGTALNNTPSRKLLEKLGFVLKETESVSFYKDESGNDIVFEGGNFVKSTKEVSHHV